MSSNLICFILYGPKNLPGDPVLIRRAVDNAKSIIKLAYQLKELRDDEKVWKEECLDQIVELGGPSMDDIDGDWLDSVLELDPEKVVGEFISTWNDGAPDTNCRDLLTCSPLNERIVFVTGEMSYGEEPGGDSYKAMKHAQQLGVFKFFEVE